MPRNVDDLAQQWKELHPELDTSPMEVIGLLKRASRLIELALEPMYETAPLTPAEADMLIALRPAKEPVIARRLAHRMGLSRAGVSKTLARLEKRGYVSRVPSPTDRRAAHVTITRAGTAIVERLLPRQLATEADLLSGLGRDRERLRAALTRLVAVMEAAIEAS